ncbi:hypothetical protein GGTG_08752 [Gaeumannomyces tritici R3-111a-1]|uniref:Uncharacterized protein n=1 Tax=Gaeumannomyces tritici (strain R3-111a-1) TaxID=644352 RepID=J3P5G3_GAET3|nr:hypothetical protein GGTG_08752 [Gaeumannomyces tritici R3-111a-1]EJT74914.1 hypothetical protein GGTG_08752 [Gaeumannomyces tritici R3-111a-1]
MGKSKEDIGKYGVRVENPIAGSECELDIGGGFDMQGQGAWEKGAHRGHPQRVPGLVPGGV